MISSIFRLFIKVSSKLTPIDSEIVWPIERQEEVIWQNIAVLFNLEHWRV